MVFAANIELQHNPDLKGRPFVVVSFQEPTVNPSDGNDPAFQVGLGIVTTASYDARKFGCRSGQAGERSSQAL